MGADFESESYFLEDEYENGQWGGPDICNNCGNFSARLKMNNGDVICEDCFDD